MPEQLKAALDAAMNAAEETMPRGVLRKDTQERWNTIFAGLEAASAALSRPTPDAAMVERLRYIASILNANADKFAVPDHIPAKVRTVLDAAAALEALGQHSEGDVERDETPVLGCDYCNNDGVLVERPGWLPRCPRCDAEYPEPEVVTPSDRCRKLEEANERVRTLQFLLARYGDRVAMANAPDPSWQQAIDDALAGRCPRCGGLHKTGSCDGPPLPTAPHPHAGKMMG